MDVDSNAKEDNKKRGRSETSVSDADASMIDDSNVSKDASQGKADDTSFRDKEMKEDSDKGKIKSPQNVNKGNSQPQSRRKKIKKAKYDKEQKGDEGEWEDLSFKETVKLQLKDISDSLANVVSKKEIESMFSTFFEKKLDKLMFKMKEEVMRSVNHRIEVLEGELHDYKDQNDKLGKRIETLENELKKKSEDMQSQTQETEKLQTAIEDTDKAFYGRANELEQYSRRNNVRIWGLAESEETEDANTTADMVVRKLNEILGLNLHRYDIDIAHRIGRKQKGVKSSRCVIVKFVSRMTKIKCLKDRKTKLKGTKIFIQEDLTSLNYSVFMATKGNNDVDKSWTIDGTIYVKWKGSDVIKKVGYAEYDEWLEWSEESDSDTS